MKLLLFFVSILPSFQSTEISDEFWLASHLVSKLALARRMNTTEQLAKVFYNPVILGSLVDNTQPTKYNLNTLLETYKSIGNTRFSTQHPAPITISMCFDELKNHTIIRDYAEILFKHTIRQDTYNSRILAYRRNGMYLIGRVIRECQYDGAGNCVKIQKTPDSEEDLATIRKIWGSGLKTEKKCFYK